MLKLMKRHAFYSMYHFKIKNPTKTMIVLEIQLMLAMIQVHVFPSHLTIFQPKSGRPGKTFTANLSNKTTNF
jgi:hypothetical protein